MGEEREDAASRAPHDRCTVDHPTTYGGRLYSFQAYRPYEIRERTRSEADQPHPCTPARHERHEEQEVLSHRLPIAGSSTCLAQRHGSPTHRSLITEACSIHRPPRQGLAAASVPQRGLAERRAQGRMGRRGIGLGHAPELAARPFLHAWRGAPPGIGVAIKGKRYDNTSSPRSLVHQSQAGRDEG